MEQPHELKTCPPQWQQLVTPGHTWQARLNKTTFIGVIAMALFALSLTRDIHGNTVGLALALAKANDGTPPSWWERFQAQPWNTLKGSVTGDGRATARPVLNQFDINPLPSDGLDASTLTQVTDLEGFVADQLAALNRADSLSSEYPACDPMKSLSGATWVDSRTGRADVPRCKVGTDTVWMASIVAQGGMYAPPVPWLGVFHKADGTWTYRNVSLDQRHARIEQHETVELAWIADQVAKDFPDLVITTDAAEAH